MAAFDRPQDAVRAGIGMVEELARFNRTASRPLGLKVGIHKGQAIAVSTQRPDRLFRPGREHRRPRARSRQRRRGVRHRSGDGGAGRR